MPKPNELKKLGLRKLQEISRDFESLRRTCEEHDNLPVAKFYEIMEGLNKDLPSKPSGIPKKRGHRKKKRKSSSTKNTPSRPEDIVIQTFQNFRRRIGKGGQADFEGLVSEVGVDLEKTNLETGARCPLAGFVAKTLYEFAEASYYNGDKNCSARYRGMVENPVDQNNLEKILKIKFSEEAFNRIAGILSPEQIQESYVYDEFSKSIKFKDENNDMISDPNIEGVVCFNGQGKKDAREILAKFTSNYLCPSLEEKVKSLDLSIEQKEREKQNQKRRIGEIENEKAEIENDRSSIVYRFEAKTVKQLKGAKKQIIASITDKKNLLGLELKVETQEIDEGDTIKKQPFMTVKITGENYRLLRREVVSGLKSINADGISHNMHAVNSSRKRGGDRIQQLEEEGRRANEELVKIEEKLAELLEKKSNSTQIDYLGLEGSNFTSYLEINRAVKERNRDLSVVGTFVEYQTRIHNIMESTIENLRNEVGEDPCLFDERTKVTRRNIEDWILLDFVEDPEMRISARDKDTVEYKDESIDLQTYHLLIDFIDAGETPTMVKKMFGVSEEFVKAASERVEGTFDAVFLDYFSEYKGRKVEVLQQLASRRLSDNAIIAIACSKRYAPRLKGRNMGEIGDILQNSGGFSIEATQQKTYLDNVKMDFRIYHIKRG